MAAVAKIGVLCKRMGQGSLEEDVPRIDAAVRQVRCTRASASRCVCVRVCVCVFRGEGSGACSFLSPDLLCVSVVCGLRACGGR